MNQVNKSDCVGCGACYSACSIRCITMNHDSEGFLYPVIDKNKCTNCTECEKICPSMNCDNTRGIRKPLNIYASKNSDEEIRYASSSGGIFSLLAEHVIKKDGIVFGAKFNDSWDVISDYTEKSEGLAAFRGSKYVQSVTGETYKQARDYLEKGKQVLYSGTPCQIAGLKAFLEKEYTNLLTVDFVCHGVPSPLVWKKYLREFIRASNMPSGQKNPSGINDIVDIKFRDKQYGWKNFSFKVSFCSKKSDFFSIIEPLNSNFFLKGFLHNLYLRPSCHNCPVKLFKSGSDITIADYWGVQNILPRFDDDKGVSLVMLNTIQGKIIYELLDKVDHQVTTYVEAVAKNPAIEKSVLPHKNRTLFFKNYTKNSIAYLVDILLTVSLSKKIIKILLYRLRLITFIRFFLGNRNSK